MERPLQNSQHSDSVSDTSSLSVSDAAPAVADFNAAVRAKTTEIAEAYRHTHPEIHRTIVAAIKGHATSMCDVSSDRRLSPNQVIFYNADARAAARAVTLTPEHVEIAREIKRNASPDLPYVARMARIEADPVGAAALELAAAAMQDVAMRQHEIDDAPRVAAYLARVAAEGPSCWECGHGPLRGRRCPCCGVDNDG